VSFFLAPQLTQNHCHSERSEEPPHFAFAFAFAFVFASALVFALAFAVVLASLVVIPAGELLLSLSLVPQPQQNGRPIHRALCDGSDVNRPHPAQLLLPLPSLLIVILTLSVAEGEEPPHFAFALPLPFWLSSRKGSAVVFVSLPTAQTTGGPSIAPCDGMRRNPSPATKPSPRLCPENHHFDRSCSQSHREQRSGEIRFSTPTVSDPTRLPFAFSPPRQLSDGYRLISCSCYAGSNPQTHPHRHSKSHWLNLCALVHNI